MIIRSLIHPWKFDKSILPLKNRSYILDFKLKLVWKNYIELLTFLAFYFPGLGRCKYSNNKYNQENFSITTCNQ